MKRTEYSFGKIDFNGSRAVIPTEGKAENQQILGLFLFYPKNCRECLVKTKIIFTFAMSFWITD